MTWHLDPITLHGRRYLAGKSYANRDKYATNVTVQIMNGTTAYLSCMLNDGTDGPIRKEDFEELSAMLRDKYGIKAIHMERHGAAKVHNTGPAPLT
jgi:hypothetical protein